MRQRSYWRQFDWWILILAVLLTVIGLAMIYSATKDTASLAMTWQRQARYAVVGVVLMMLVSLLSYGLLEPLQWPSYLLTLLILTLTLLFGSSEIGDVRRFIYIGNTSIQPAFPALILLIVSVASFLARNAPASPRFQEFIISLVMVAGAALLVFFQPNLSTATLYVATWIIMVFASGMKITYVGGFLLLGLLALPLVWRFLDDYMRDRIFNFLDPTRDPGAYYNIQQALISIGSGGLLGKGFASGSQSQLHFLRVRHTDFIFSVICEELGFVGAAAILLIFGFLLVRLLRIAANAPDITGRLIVVGVTTYIFYQLLINLGMNLNVIPVAGLPLPFISSGGSALVVTFIGLGLVESVAMHRER